MAARVHGEKVARRVPPPRAGRFVAEAYRKLYKRFGAQGWWPEIRAGGREKTARMRPIPWGALRHLRHLRGPPNPQRRAGKARRAAAPPRSPRPIGAPEGSAPAAKPPGTPSRVFGAESRRRASPFEVIVGAILTQNTSWKNVERALANLKREQLLTPERLFSVPLARLARLIRPSGYFNIKAQRLSAFLKFFFKEYGGDLRKMAAVPTRRLREQLLGVRGIGPETADSILLYALDRPVFVVDAYTRRVLSRHGVARLDAEYEEIRRLFEDRLPGKSALFNEYHALIVRVGKELCRKTPQCDSCPLKPLLPRGVPVFS